MVNRSKPFSYQLEIVVLLQIYTANIVLLCNCRMLSPVRKGKSTKYLSIFSLHIQHIHIELCHGLCRIVYTHPCVCACAP